MSEEVTRRDFNLQSALALLSGVTITISGCGGGSSSPTSPSTPGGDNNVQGSVGTNHGHVAVITAAQLNARNDLVLSITGTADHPHTVTLTGGELGQIAGGGRVSKQSTTNAGHDHIVTFN